MSAQDRTPGTPGSRVTTLVGGVEWRATLEGDGVAIDRFRDGVGWTHAGAGRWSGTRIVDCDTALPPAVFEALDAALVDSGVGAQGLVSGKVSREGEALPEAIPTPPHPRALHGLSFGQPPGPIEERARAIASEAFAHARHVPGGEPLSEVEGRTYRDGKLGPILVALKRVEALLEQIAKGVEKPEPNPIELYDGYFATGPTVRSSLTNVLAHGVDELMALDRIAGTRVTRVWSRMSQVDRAPDAPASDLYAIEGLPGAWRKTNEPGVYYSEDGRRVRDIRSSRPPKVTAYKPPHTVPTFGAPCAPGTLQGRLLAAWAASGMPIGRLLTSAVREAGHIVFRTPSETPDEALVEMAERYAASRGSDARGQK